MATRSKRKKLQIADRILSNTHSQVHVLEAMRVHVAVRQVLAALVGGR